MKTTTHNHGIFSLSLIFLLLSPHISVKVEAQSGWGPTRNTNLYPYSRFSSSLAIIIAVLVTSLFFMVFYFIYIRYCTVPSSAVRQPIPLRTVVVAARGLDASVIETFPTFSYSEVKDHKIGKEALECAVCLNEFEDDETLRLIPKCDHVFHPECIDAWLESHVTCPVCRADLVPQPGDCPVHVPDPTDSIDEDCEDVNVEGSNSRNDEIVIQLDYTDNEHQEPTRVVNRNLSFKYPNRPPKAVVNRNLSFGNPNRPPISRAMNRNMSFGNINRMARSWSMRPRMFGIGKLGRSRSAGNILVQPGEDLERFTLRLPSGVKKEVINRASLNRTRSFAPTSRGKNRDDDIAMSDREVKSDRWDFFTRALSMKLRSPKGVAETGESSGSTLNGGRSRTLNKLRSFNCLVPRAADETGLISGEPVEPTA